MVDEPVDGELPCRFSMTRCHQRMPPVLASMSAMSRSRLFMLSSSASYRELGKESNGLARTKDADNLIYSLPRLFYRQHYLFSFPMIQIPVNCGPAYMHHGCYLIHCHRTGFI